MDFVFLSVLTMKALTNAYCRGVVMDVSEALIALALMKKLNKKKRKYVMLVTKLLFASILTACM